MLIYVLFVLFGLIVAIVTRRHFAKALLFQREIEQRLRQFIEQSPYAVAMLDKEMKYVFISQKWLSDYQLDEKQLQGKSHYEAFPEIADYWREIHERCLQGHTEKSEAEPFVRKNGKTDWIRWEVRPWYDIHNQIGGILIFSEDISEKIYSDEALFRWAYVFQNASWGMALATVENRFIAVNRAFAEMHGTQPEEWVDRPIQEMFDDEFQINLPELISETHRLGHLTYESVHIRKDGTKFPVLAEVSAFKDTTGKVLFRAANFQDITTRKQHETESKKTEEKLRASERKFSIIFDKSPFAIALLKMPDATIADVNPTFLRLFGYNTEEIIGKTNEELGIKLDFEAKSQNQESGHQSEVIRKRISKITNRAGKMLIVSSSTEPILLDGEPFLLLNVEDITLQKEAEEGLHQAIQARDEFLSIASHELKTPLTSLKLQAEVFRRAILRNDDRIFSLDWVTKQVETLDRQFDRLARLVDDMLDVARIQTGKLFIHKEKFNMADLVFEVTDRLYGQFLASSDSEPKVQIQDEIIGYWDRFRIEQVMINLLMNAIRYGKRNPIEIEATQVEDKAILRVKDHGIGISKTNQERIFDRFERAVNKNDVSGLGLGLYISKQIVLAHGGRIWVESDLGKGSLFTVELPLQSGS